MNSTDGKMAFILQELKFERISANEATALRQYWSLSSTTTDAVRLFLSNDVWQLSDVDVAEYRFALERIAERPDTNLFSVWYRIAQAGYTKFEPKR